MRHDGSIEATRDSGSKQARKTWRGTSTLGVEKRPSDQFWPRVSRSFARVHHLTSTKSAFRPNRTTSLMRSRVQDAMT